MASKPPGLDPDDDHQSQVPGQSRPLQIAMAAAHFRKPTGQSSKSKQNSATNPANIYIPDSSTVTGLIFNGSPKLNGDGRQLQLPKSDPSSNFSSWQAASPLYLSSAEWWATPD
ncbi:hypothetical protein ACLOJK_019744 [Asimina triloba]